MCGYSDVYVEPLAATVPTAEEEVEERQLAAAFAGAGLLDYLWIAQQLSDLSVCYSDAPLADLMAVVQLALRQLGVRPREGCGPFLEFLDHAQCCPVARDARDSALDIALLPCSVFENDLSSLTLQRSDKPPYGLHYCTTPVPLLLCLSLSLSLLYLSLSLSRSLSLLSLSLTLPLSLSVTLYSVLSIILSVLDG